VATEQRVNVDDLRVLVTKIFEKVGMETPDATRLADSLVFADLRGVNSHGVLRVPEYVEKLTTKGVNPKGKPQIVRSFGGCVVVDGGNSMGQIGMHFAMNEVIRRAEEHGIAAAAIRGSNHSGAMAYYAIQALPHDMIGIATTNALPTMAPWGGAEKIVGINPLGVAIPANTELPIVHDAAFSGSSKFAFTSKRVCPFPKAGRWTRMATQRPMPRQPLRGCCARLVNSRGCLWR
jgi:LDH2 family malate/lactate/ureidoglycolate dehydrogenase